MFRPILAKLTLGIALSISSSSILFSQDQNQPSVVAVIERYRADLETLRFKYEIPMSQSQTKRMLQFYDAQLKRLSNLNYEELNVDERVDYQLFKNKLEHEVRKLEIDMLDDAAISPLLPFAAAAIELLEKREAVEPISGKDAAVKLQEIVLATREAKRTLAEIKSSARGKFSGTQAIRAARRTSELRSSLNSWHRFYDGYDPDISWWTRESIKEVSKGLEDYADSLRRDLAELEKGDDRKIVGEPIGEQALLAELRYEMIPYTPAELIRIADEQFEWCDREMLKASRELGFGDDWHAAMEHVKAKHVAPGDQPHMIKELALEATKFIEDRELVTVPPLCKETWRMEMMSPERQRVNPFFLGGPTIIVSYPTDTMTHEEKLMSMRGNNRHFSRATVQHELIPGHYLQMFMMKRYKPYREIFDTPFWLEGWALYWEMRLWDLDFPQSPEDRIGMLFWRMHRCARIKFSLSYQTGKMSAEECVKYLIDRVAHEPATAEAEVRRSVMGGYGPLYQAAYMLGGLQIRALHEELVNSGKMTEKEFHDAILHENSIPIEMLRAKLLREQLPIDYKPNWRFAK